jgi:uncharacterized protein
LLDELFDHADGMFSCCVPASFSRGLLVMRLSKERIRHISESIAVRLQHEGQVTLIGDHKAFVEQIDHAILEELSIEDRLNAEVRQLLNVYEHDIERGHVDYQRMFTLVKNKLARERGIIL